MKPSGNALGPGAKTAPELSVSPIQLTWRILVLIFARIFGFFWSDIPSSTARRARPGLFARTRRGVVYQRRGDHRVEAWRERRLFTTPVGAMTVMCCSATPIVQYGARPKCRAQIDGPGVLLLTSDHVPNPLSPHLIVDSEPARDV